jgi:hypothetical protein
MIYKNLQYRDERDPSGSDDDLMRVPINALDREGQSAVQAGMDEFGHIAREIQTDSVITPRKIHKLSSALSNIQIPVGPFGVNQTMEQVHLYTSVIAGVDFIREIERGDFSHEQEVVFLSDKATRALATRGYGKIELPSVRFLTDAQALILSDYVGEKLDLSGLREISDVQAECLLRSRTRIVDLSGLVTISDTFAENVSAINDGYCVYLRGLKHITNTQAEMLYYALWENQILCSREMEDHIRAVMNK